MVGKRGQGRSDRLLLVSPPRAESSLLATLGSSCGRLPAEVHRDRCKHKRNWDRRLVVVVVFVVVFVSD